MKSTEVIDLREQYAKQLVEEGIKNDQIIVLDGDLKESTYSNRFEELFPERFIDMGISEQNMVGVAAGLARCGKIPVVHSFAAFISMRACEQVRTDIAFQKLNVKLVVSHAGVSAASAGTTHHTIEDIAILRSMPNMKVLVPGDALDMKNCVKEMFETEGPVYLRISASNEPRIILNDNLHINGNAYKINIGKKIAIFTTGVTLSIGKKVTDLLMERENINATHLHFSTVKPIDVKSIQDVVEKTDVIYTIEEHNIIGGFGSAIAEVVAGIGSCRVIRLGINDHYCTPGSQKFIFEKEGLTPESILNKISSFK